MNKHVSNTKRRGLWCGVLSCLTAWSLAFAGPAFAAKDLIYPSGASASVNSTTVTVSNNFSSGNDGSTTLDHAVYAGNTVSVSATWSIVNRSAEPGQDTSYGSSGLTATFSASTTTKPVGAPAVTVGAISGCTLTSASSTCTTPINFTVPAVTGGYQLKVTVGGLGSSTGLATKDLYINFSVDTAPAQKLDTKLTVDKKCVLLNQGSVDLTATLQELASGKAIEGANIDFYIDPALDGNGVPTVASVGTGATNASGVATLSYNINTLGVGDHDLYAEFDGDDSYKPSNDSDILGISYLFVGFQPPINADGTSIFGGRVIPIKIKLIDANGAPVTNAAPTVWLTSYDKDFGLGVDLEQVSSVSAADTGNIMRYVPLEQQYIYNWDATDLANGTYGVVVNLGDSAACRPQNPYAIITVAKKSKK